MLLESGTLTEDELEKAGYRGKVVNFKWDIESSLEATIVQKVRNQKDKAFGVNVLCGGDPLEIYTATDGEVIFKKYSPVGELAEFASQYADVLAKISSMPTIITDRDHVIAAAGVSKREFLERRVTTVLEGYMENRKTYSATQQTLGDIQPIEGIEHYASVIYPIIAAGDVSGAVVMLTGEQTKIPTNAEIKLAQTAAAFLGKQMEE